MIVYMKKSSSIRHHRHIVCLTKSVEVDAGKVKTELYFLTHLVQKYYLLVKYNRIPPKLLQNICRYIILLTYVHYIFMYLFLFHTFFLFYSKLLKFSQHGVLMSSCLRS